MIEAIPSALVETLAKEFAEWRISGCPGFGFSEQFRLKVRKAAKSGRVAYTTLFAEAHRLAYVRIDQVEQARLVVADVS